MPEATVEDILRGTQRDVARISRLRPPRELLTALKEADRKLAARLRQESRRFGAPDARFTGAAALAYQQQIQVQIRFLQLRLLGLTERQAIRVVEHSMRRSVRILEQLERRFTGLVRPLRIREAGAMTRAITNKRASILATIPGSVDRYGLSMIGVFENRMRAGLLQGLSMDEMTAVLTGHGGPKGEVSVSSRLLPDGRLIVRTEKIPEGLFVRYKYWAERIVRTETMRSYNQARRVGYEQMREQIPDLQKKIVAILDARTAQDSIAVNGQIRELDDEFIDGAGRRYLYPPARPNDRETTIPWRPEWTAPAAQEKDALDRALLGELTPAEERALIKRIARQ